MNKVRKFMAVATVIGLPVLAMAQTAATVPDATELTAKITAIGGVAGAAAVLGLSIWAYVKTKRKGGQALS